jgi:hypothetical protein
VPSREDMILHDLKRMDEVVARKRTCGHVMMEFLLRGVKQEGGTRGCGGE